MVKFFSVWELSSSPGRDEALFGVARMGLGGKLKVLGLVVRRVLCSRDHSFRCVRWLCFLRVLLCCKDLRVR